MEDELYLKKCALNGCLLSLSNCTDVNEALLCMSDHSTILNEIQVLESQLQGEGR